VSIHLRGNKTEVCTHRFRKGITADLTQRGSPSANALNVLVAQLEEFVIELSAGHVWDRTWGKACNNTQ
jgi:hypothetical protein